MSDTLRLILQLVDIAPFLERTLGDEWPRFRDDLLSLSGTLERDGDSTVLDQAFDAFLARLLAAAPEDAKGAIRQAMAPPAEDNDVWRSGGVPDDDAVPTGSPVEAALPDHVVEVPVFYGTDRKPSDGDDHFEGRRGDQVSYGLARVTVPTEGRDVGDLTSPKWWKLEFSSDPERHVVLASVEGCDRAGFVVQLQFAVADADEKDVLLFVHGYNVTFNDAARRAAQLAVDLKFRGRTLLYSWASAGDAKLYTVDESTIDWSENHFRAFLQLALTEVGAGRLHVIAHSMGNRAVVRALERIDTAALSGESASLCQVIFAAPDIDAGTFRNLAALFRGRAERCTLYASSRDVALKASKLVHGYARAGEAENALVIVDGVDTVDASRVDTSLIGLRHSYFGSARTILSDIASLLNERKEPSLRFDVKPVGAPPRRYWAYRE